MYKRNSQKKDSNMSERLSSSERKPKYSRSDLMRMARVDLVDRFIILQNLNIKFYEEVNPMMAKSNSELASAREVNAQLASQLEQLGKKEALVNMRLSNKQLETHDLMTQVQEMRAVQLDGATSQINHKLLDPAVSHIFEKMKSELAMHKKKCQEALEDASAFKFNPDSQLGKRLVAKCRQLSQENRELSEEVSKLEDEVSVERQVVRESRTQQLEFERFMLEMEEQLESMQGVVVAQNCTMKSLTSQLTHLSDHNKHLHIQLQLKSPPLRDVSTMVTGLELGVKEGRYKADVDDRKETKRRDDNVKNNHVTRGTSKGRSKKERGDRSDKEKKEKTDKERGDNEREIKKRDNVEKEDKDRVDKDRGNKERVTKDKGDKERIDKDRIDKDRSDKDRGDKDRSDKDRSDKDRGDKERSEKTRKRTHDGRESDKRTRHRSRSRNNHEVSNGHRSNYK